MTYCKITFFTLLLLSFACNNNTVIKEYHKNTKIPRIIYKYKDKNDTTTYTSIEFYKTGDTCSVNRFEHGLLKSIDSWDSLKIKTHKEFILTDIKNTGFLHVFLSKKWNPKGILIFESKILSKGKKQLITRDSLGNIIKIDTIPLLPLEIK